MQKSGTSTRKSVIEISHKWPQGGGVSVCFLLFLQVILESLFQRSFRQNSSRRLGLSDEKDQFVNLDLNVENKTGADLGAFKIKVTFCVLYHALPGY